MEKGHIELRELLAIAILIVGLAAAALVLSGMGASHQEALQAPVGGADAPVPGEEQDEEPVQAQPSDEPAAPEEPAPEPTSMTTGEMLDSGLARADTRFYSSIESGEWKTHSYRWAPGLFNETPDSMPLRENDLRASSVRFNGRYEDSLRGAAFKTYEIAGLTEPTKIFGTLLFLGGSPMFDSFLANQSEFVMRYDPHPQRTQQMEGCSILASQDYVTMNGSAVSAYDFGCKIMYGVST